MKKTIKEQLIEIEKCEREAGRTKLISKLNKQRDEICKPFNNRILALEREKAIALEVAGLTYIYDGCGKNHPEIEAYNLKTNEIIKKILREKI